MTTIKLDYDTRSVKEGAKLLRRIRAISRITRMFDNCLLSFEVRRTRHGMHAYINVSKELSDSEVLILQLLLGSDWRRELFNFRRIRDNVPNWNVLFIRKYSFSGRLISEERPLTKRERDIMNREVWGI